MGDGRQPLSIGGSKADLCPDEIRFVSEAGPWQSKTQLEKGLLVLVFVFFVAAVVFLVFFLLVYLAAPQQQTVISEVCTTLECLQTAAYISDSLDPTVDPCEDFYQYACGRWAEKHPIPLSLSGYNNFLLIHRDLQQAMRDLLSDDESNSIGGIAKAKTFYKSCEDTDAIDAIGRAPLLDLLKTGGANLFPTLEPNWVDENLTLSQAVARVGAMGSLGSSPLVIMFIYSDQKQSDRNIIYLDQTNYNLPSRQMYLGDRNSSTLLLYQQHYVDVMTSLGADVSTAERDAKELVDFEILVANATDPPEMTRDAEARYHKMTVRNLTARYPQFDWLPYLSKQLSEADINITMDEQVVVTAVQYFDKIFSVADAAPRRALMNYCMWRIVLPLVGLLDKKLRDIKTQFKQAIHGNKRSSERWEDCVTVTDAKFPETAGRLYVDRYFSNRAKQKVESMIGDLIVAFKEMLHESDWMSDQTKRAALEKANAIVHQIGYPDDIMNDTALNEKFAGCNITADGYFDNHIALFRHQRLTTLKKLREPSDRHAWHVSAATVNAFYNRQRNSILFPAGILHKPFYSDQFLDALNYGGIGFAIGHEITHGFDDSGRVFDKEGNIHPWWEAGDLKRFRERYDCMVKQYSNYTEPSLKVRLNGKLTIGEDIADNGGLKEAYRAYRKLISKRGKEEPRLPVLNYTPDQLFFIGAAQVWCGELRQQAKLIYLQTDFHSPRRFRVVGPFQNNEEFSKAFSCPVGSYMNPQRKCHVW